jgi:hypothetical protein
MNLTDEQIEAAAKAMYKVGWKDEPPYDVTPWEAVARYYQNRWLLIARAGAPFLQMPWQDYALSSLEHEIKRRKNPNNDTAWQAGYNTAIDKVLELFPNPVDPRREKINRVLMVMGYDLATGLADTILAALDAKDEGRKGICGKAGNWPRICQLPKDHIGECWPTKYVPMDAKDDLFMDTLGALELAVKDNGAVTDEDVRIACNSYRERARARRKI